MLWCNRICISRILLIVFSIVDSVLLGPFKVIAGHAPLSGPYRK